MASVRLHGMANPIGRANLVPGLVWSRLRDLSLRICPFQLWSIISQSNSNSQANLKSNNLNLDPDLDLNLIAN